MVGPRHTTAETCDHPVPHKTKQTNHSTMIAREDLPEFYRAVAGVLYGEREVADSTLLLRARSSKYIGGL